MMNCEYCEGASRCLLEMDGMTETLTMEPQSCAIGLAFGGMTFTEVNQTEIR